MFAIPFPMFVFVGNIISFSIHAATVHQANEKFRSFLKIFANKITILLPSLHSVELLGGVITAAALFGYRCRMADWYEPENDTPGIQSVY